MCSEPVLPWKSSLKLLEWVRVDRIGAVLMTIQIVIRAMLVVWFVVGWWGGGVRGQWDADWTFAGVGACYMTGCLVPGRHLPSVSTWPVLHIAPPHPHPKMGCCSRASYVYV